MISPFDIKYINTNLLLGSSITEISIAMDRPNIKQELLEAGYSFNPVEKKYTKGVLIDTKGTQKKNTKGIQKNIELDYKLLMELEASETFSYRVDGFRVVIMLF